MLRMASAALGTRANEYKLVSPKTAQEVTFTHDGTQLVCNSAQQRVARFMAVGIVDLLETIQIEKRDHDQTV